MRQVGVSEDDGLDPVGRGGHNRRHERPGAAVRHKEYLPGAGGMDGIVRGASERLVERRLVVECCREVGNRDLVAATTQNVGHRLPRERADQRTVQQNNHGRCHW
jgi:poly(3-hydroxybutyrate) depolymerase